MAKDRRKFVVGALVAGGLAKIIKIKVFNKKQRVPFCHDYLIEHTGCHHQEWVRHSALWERYRRADGGFFCRECGPPPKESPNRYSAAVTHTQAFWPAPPSSL